MTTIAITALKGGVGKTTTAVNLSRGLARAGRDVLGLDLDRTNQGFCQFADNLDGVDIRATTAGRVAGMVQRNKLPFAVIDTPPNLEKEPVAALRAADMVFVPVVPEMMVVEGLARFMALVSRVKDPQYQGANPSLQVRILLTMVNGRDREALDIEAKLRQRFGAVIWPESIPLESAVSSACNAYRSVLDHSPAARGAKIYRDLTRYILETYDGS